MTTPTPTLTTRTTTCGADEGRTLAGEHARLMREVTRRAQPVLALLGTRAWPHAELGTLTTYLRAAVLRQVSDEEALLFRHDSFAPPFAELSADHVRLHTLTAELERVHATPVAPQQLRALVEELLETLRRHLAEEQEVLAELSTVEGDVPSVADLAAADQPWMPTDDTPTVIDVDSLPAGRASEMCIEHLLRLRPGQRAELHAHNDQLLRPVSRWLHDFDAARFGFAAETIGPDHVLLVTCRHANAPAGIGYPG
jgi:hypothetical protein